MEDLLWAELQPWCLSLQWKTCPWAEHMMMMMITSNTIFPIALGRKVVFQQIVLRFRLCPKFKRCGIIRIGQRFWNYGPRTTCGLRSLHLWSFRKEEKYNSTELRISLYLKLVEFGNDTWQSPFTFLSLLTFYEIYYSTRLPTSHSTLSNKRGIKSTMNVVFLVIFSLHIWRRARNPARDHSNS